MKDWSGPSRAAAITLCLSLCPVLVSAQVPSDADIAQFQQYRGAQHLPDAAAVKGTQLGLPDDEQMNAQMRRLREATQRALQDPGVSVPKSPVPQRKYQAATQEEREQYLSNLDNASRQMQQAHPSNGLDDLPSVLERYQQEQDRMVRRMQSDVPDIPQDAVLVFVSFSMPEGVLTALARQARAVGATLVLRGMKEGSLRETKEAALAVNRAGAAWQINPGLFESFNVTSVPTFVVTGNKDVLDRGCPLDGAVACSLSGTYASISGDLSIELALDTIRLRSAVPYVRKLAEERLGRLTSKRAG